MTEEKIVYTMQTIVKHLLTIDNVLAKLRTDLNVVTTLLAIQMGPTDPKDALAKIEKIQSEFAALDPNAPARQQAADLIEAVKLLGQHGGPKQA